jgi:hypothetical protein
VAETGRRGKSLAPYTTKNPTPSSRPAVEKLRRLVVEYWIHYERFFGFGERDIPRAEEMADGSANEAVGERVRFEVLEDRNRLNMPDLGKPTAEEFQKLCDRFHEWRRRCRRGSRRQAAREPPTCQHVVADADSLRALASVAEDILSHSVAVGRDNFMRRRYSRRYAGYAWLVESRAVKLYREGIQTNPQRRGRMKIGSEQLDDAWFQLVGLFNICDGGKPPGEFWYSDSVF